jgi:hypothetical protein
MLAAPKTGITGQVPIEADGAVCYDGGTSRKLNDVHC